MNKEYKVFNSEKEWEDAGEPDKSYYKLDTDFCIRCSCGESADIYVKYWFEYGVQNVIKCRMCEKELELYGCDG